ncbi:Undecaprenyl-phosphate galactosephosphotransferase [hydrothermal vent metagenome]|uniref:Undecaprenyl-phosphate galactosephosphotransferase n=1 Tax=hydrothermal vent metagenome TaxID=652676 RepID=A0A1W1CAJ5_9ZZZZ
MSTIYCNSSNIGKLLKEINIGLNIGNEVQLKIQLDKSITLYYGYFVYHGFKVKNMVELKNKIIVDLVKSKSIQTSKDKKYSFLIKLPRTGKYGKRIFVYKLRTMQPYSEYIQDLVIKKNGLNDDGTIRDDFRITKIGKILRRYWLDELPMLINFFKGDLKLIGFRPLSDAMLSQYPKEFVLVRNRYKPGLIPPYYIDKPNSFEGLVDSEKRYIQKYRESGIITDTVYFFKFLNVLLFKGVRSS